MGLLLSTKLPSTNLETKVPGLEKSMIFQETDKLEVKKVIKQFRNNTGAGGASNKIIECCSPAVDYVIANPFDRCIGERIFSKCLKIAEFILVHKKGDRNKPENYKPISLLSSMSKVFVKLFLKHIIKFCQKKSIFTKNQYEFRSRSSCTDAMASVTEFRRLEIDKKKLPKQACFIDLQKKRFDALDHTILLNERER